MTASGRAKASVNSVSAWESSITPSVQRYVGGPVATLGANDWTDAVGVLDGTGEAGRTVAKGGGAHDATSTVANSVRTGILRSRTVPLRASSPLTPRLSGT